MIGTLYLGGVFDPDTGAADVSQRINHRVENLASEVKALREHNEEMAKYLNNWTPLKCRKELGIKEKWIIPGLGLPEIVPNSYLQVKEMRYDVDGKVSPVRDVPFTTQGPRP